MTEDPDGLISYTGYLDWSEMPSKKRRVLVTGVARWWGALVVQRLVEDPDVAEVIGIDVREPRYDLGRADYLKLDIRHSLIGKLSVLSGSTPSCTR